MDIKLKNTRVEWIRVYNEFVKDEEKQNKTNSFFFNVDCTDTDVCVLRYYYPLRNYLLDKGKKVNLRTYVAPKGLDKNDLERAKKSFEYRRYQFLSQDPYIALAAPENEKKDEDDNASDIFPMLIIPYGSTPDGAVFGKLCDIYIRDTLLLPDLHNKKRLFETLCSFLYDLKDDTEGTSFKDFSARLQLLTVAEDKRKFWEENKKIFAVENLKNFSEKDILSIIFFFFLLRAFIRRSFQSVQQNNKWNFDFLNRMIMNSKSYGEGIWQLIENAHEHSQGKIAFFGMRFHKANIDVTMSKLVENSLTRKRLWDQYIYKHKDESDNIFNIENSNGTKKYADFLEVFVMDDALYAEGEGSGILDAIKRDQTELLEVPTSIGDIFKLEEKKYKDGRGKEQYYIKHYGLRWLQKHVRNNDGILWVYSPKFRTGESVYYYNGYGTYEIDLPTNNFVYSTEYNILFPISYSKTGQTNKAKKTKQKVTINTPYFENIEDVYKNAKNGIIYNKIEIRLGELLQEGQDILDSVRILEAKFEEFQGEYEIKRNLPNYITLTQNILHAHADIEILAKALFLYIYKKHEKTFKIRIAIDFKDQRDLIYEFVRIFSIFYLKENTNEYMDKVQIALCSSKKQSNNTQNSLTEINFILAGKNLKTARDTADKFVYYNAESALEFVSLLNYFTIDSAETENEDLAVSLFPFELIPLSDNKSSMFLSHMQNCLETPIWGDNLGCKMTDVRIRLGSKIRIDQFYEAELLFHSIGNIRRFAYLIAQDIISDYDKIKDSYIYIIGYENYSSVLVQEIGNLLKAYELSMKNFIVAVDTQVKGTFPKMDVPDSISGEKQINVFTIIPIGTTMSTIYKEHSSFKRGLEDKVNKDKINFVRNYSIIAVGDDYCSGETGNKSEIFQKYIQKVSLPESKADIWKKAILMKEFAGDKMGETEVRYCLAARAKWYDANEISVDEEFMTRPLSHTDKTSTLFEAVVQTKMSKNVLQYYNRRNKIRWLDPGYDNNERPFSYFRYGHIQQRKNHHQFYFDFKLITEKREKQIIKWLNGVSKNIEEDAYNLVFAPLSESNAAFLKLVLDNVFKNNFHLIHIDIRSTAKEQVRTRFDFIPEEIKRIKDSYSKVNVYYVDDLIYTGETISRAAKFALMLSKEVNALKNQVDNRPYVFTKVFLLVNRSSYETAYQWVDNPAEDWLGFINLAIPSYNMESGTCPGCRVRDRYELLRKRSTTSELIKYFSGHAKKQDLVSLDEYDRLLKAQIEIGKNSTYEEMYLNYRNFGSSALKRKLRIKGEKEQKENIIAMLFAKDNYLRLKTTDEAYRKLIYNQECQLDPNSRKIDCEIEKIRSNITREIMKMLYGALTVDKNDTEYDKIMKLNSYIKSISRQYLSRNYYVLESIYQILHCIFILMIWNDPINNLIETKDNSGKESVLNNKARWVELFNLYPEEFKEMAKHLNLKAIIDLEQSDFEKQSRLRLETFKTVIHRLAILHSDFIIKKEIVNRVMDIFDIYDKNYDKIYDKNYDKGEMDKVFIEYLASVKMATMTEDDDAMCLMLKDSYKSMVEETVNEK